VHKGCTLYVNDERREASVQARKNRVFFLNRQLYFLNKPISLLSMTYDASTIVEVQGRRLTINNDILMEARGQRESSRIASLIAQPRHEAEVHSRQALHHAEETIRNFLEIREEALAFLSNLRANPRKTMLELSGTFVGKNPADPVGEMLALYTTRLAKSMEEVQAAVSDVETKGGKDQADRLYSTLYLIGKLQDLFFQGKDPKKLEILKAFARELGFNDALLDEVAKKSETERVVDLFRNIHLIELPGT
jgi:hypothetical protein